MNKLTKYLLWLLMLNSIGFRKPDHHASIVPVIPGIIRQKYQADLFISCGILFPCSYFYSGNTIHHCIGICGNMCRTGHIHNKNIG